MITPSFGLTATERVLPRLALDFTTASLDNRVTFARSLDTATRVNSSGYIETVNANTARFDYDPTTLACKGLLIEESRANSALYSEDIEGVSWYPIRSSVTTVTDTIPNGGTTAQKLTEDETASNNHRLGQSFTSSAVTYTYSIFAKPAGRNWIQLCTAALTGVFFDVQNGTVGTANGGHVGKIEPFGNGWYRCSVTFTSGGGNRPLEIALATTNGVTSYTGDGSSGVLLYGAQIETGAFATSYIPTESTAVTRNADVATMTGTNFSDWWNTTNDSLVFEYEYLSENAGGALGGVGLDTFNTTARFNVVNAVRATGTSYPSPVINGTAAFGAGKIALCLKENDYRAFRNGINITTDSNGTMIPSNATTFNIGNGYTGSNYMNGYIKKIFAYPMRLTNAELAAFSK